MQGFRQHCTPTLYSGSIAPLHCIQSALHHCTEFRQHCTTALYSGRIACNTALYSGSIAPLHCIQAALHDCTVCWHHCTTIHCIQAALFDHCTVFWQHCTTSLYRIPEALHHYVLIQWRKTFLLLQFFVQERMLHYILHRVLQYTIDVSKSVTLHITPSSAVYYRC